MNIEVFKKQFHTEGFAHIYEWVDEPGVVYPEHTHKGRVSFYVTNGSIVMNINGVEHTLREGMRIDVPIGVPHSAIVGPKGCSFLVGEEIEGDS